MTTQKELIEFCKENDPNYNKDASFKVLEPFWKKNAIGITETEWKRGFYVCIDGKGKSNSHDGEVYYFTFNDLPKAPIVNDLYDTHYKKFFINLERLGYWGSKIVKKDFGVIIKSTETQKGALEQIKEHVLYAQMPSERLETMKEIFRPPFEEFTEFMKGIAPEDPQKIEKLRNMFDKELYSHEEFPIQKIHMQTMYKNDRSETSIIITKPSIEGRMLLFMSDEIALSSENDYYKFSFTKERFSDLVDLMIEARKDLLK